MKVIYPLTFGSSATATALFSSPFSDQGAWGSNADVVGGIAPEAGTIRNLYMRVTTAPGVGKSWTFTLQIGGVDTALTCTISDANVQNSDLTNSVSIAAGDRLHIKRVGTGTPAASGVGYGQLQMECTTANRHNYGSTVGATVSTATNGWLLTSDNVAGIGTNDGPMPFAGTIRSIYIRTSVVAGVGNTRTILLVKNGVEQDGAGGTTDTRCTITGNVATTANASFAMSFVAGDTVFMRYKATAGTPAVTRLTYGLGVESTVDGESMWQGRDAGTPSTSVVNYTHPAECKQAYSSTEDTILMVYPFTAEYTLSDLYVKCDTAPGAAKSYTHTLRKAAGATSLAVVITGAATTTGNDTNPAHAVTPGVGETVTISMTPAGTPTTSRRSWGIKYYIAPAASSQRHRLTLLGVG